MPAQRRGTSKATSMTALTIIKDKHVVHLITDGAGMAGNRLVSLAPKVIAIPHLGIAVAGRGSMLMLANVRTAIADYHTVDDMLAAFPARLRKNFGWRAKLLPKLFNFDLGGVGIKGNRSFAYVLSSLARPGVPTFEFVPVGDCWSSPMIALPALEDAVRRSPRDIAGAARAILDEQRKSPDAVVGAYGQLTTVDVMGVHTRCIITWPDIRLGLIDKQTEGTPAR